MWTHLQALDTDEAHVAYNNKYPQALDTHEEHYFTVKVEEEE
jgi:hypothetical protein